MFRILSGILTIGNLEFSTDDEGFTRQNCDEEKSKNNLSIIAVRISSKIFSPLTADVINDTSV